MEGEEREEERDRYGERKHVCLARWGEIEKQRRRDGGRYRYRWRWGRGKNNSYTRCIDFSVDGNFDGDL